MKFKSQGIRGNKTLFLNSQCPPHLTSSFDDDYTLNGQIIKVPFKTQTEYVVEWSLGDASHPVSLTPNDLVRTIPKANVDLLKTAREAFDSVYPDHVFGLKKNQWIRPIRSRQRYVQATLLLLEKRTTSA